MQLYFTDEKSAQSLKKVQTLGDSKRQKRKMRLISKFVKCCFIQEMEKITRNCNLKCVYPIDRYF